MDPDRTVPYHGVHSVCKQVKIYLLLAWKIAADDISKSYSGGRSRYSENNMDPLKPRSLRACLHGAISWTGPRSPVGNMSGYRCVSDCRSRGREFDPGPVPYFRGDWSWNNFYGRSPPFRWFIQEGLLSVTSESMCTNYWLTACSSLSRKKCG